MTDLFFITSLHDVHDVHDVSLYRSISLSTCHRNIKVNQSHLLYACPAAAPAAAPTMDVNLQFIEHSLETVSQLSTWFQRRFSAQLCLARVPSEFPDCFSMVLILRSPRRNAVVYAKRKKMRFVRKRYTKYKRSKKFTH